MDTRTPNSIHSALVFDIGIPSAKAQKVLRDHNVAPKVVTGFDPSVSVEDFDLVLGFLPEEANNKIAQAVPLAAFLNKTLSIKPKRMANHQTIFATSNIGFDRVNEEWANNRPISEKTRIDVNRDAALHSGWVLGQFKHSAKEWEEALNTLKLTNTLEVGFPRHLWIKGDIKHKLRYGENPHQQAALYLLPGSHEICAAAAKQIQGKELSYNNLNDVDAAFELVSEFDPKKSPACAIIKHANPCGVAFGTSLKDAYLKALACDSVSAFGGVLAFNQTLDGETAEEISKIFTEVIIAPEADEDARRILSAKKNLRLLAAGGLPDPIAPRLTYRSVAGGLLVQTRDNGRVTREMLKVVTERQPTEQEFSDMLLAFTIAKHVKSNAIVYVKDGVTAGIGAGQMSRVDSARIATFKATEAQKIAGWEQPRTHGSAAASEAFFPFPDALLTVADAGATAVIQPGGSMNDQKVIDAANERGLAMAFTGMRHFLH